MRFKTINDDKLNDFQVDINQNRFGILLIKGDNILVIKNHDVISIPVGINAENLELITAIDKYMKKQFTVDFDLSEFEPILNITNYQKNYHVKRHIYSTVKTITNYFIGPYKDMNLDELNKKGFFDKTQFQLMNIDELKNYLNNEKNNLIDKYSKNELYEVLDAVEYHKSNDFDEKIKKLVKESKKNNK